MPRLTEWMLEATDFLYLFFFLCKKKLNYISELNSSSRSGTLDMYKIMPISISEEDDSQKKYH